MLRTSRIATSAALIPLAALLCSEAGCGASAPPTGLRPDAPAQAGPPVALKVRAPFFIPGEQLTWQISLDGVVGAEAVMAVGQPGMMKGRPIIILRSRLESSGVLSVLKNVRDDMTTWVDLSTAAPIYHHADVTIGSREGSIETHFGNGSFTISFERSDRHAHIYRQKIPPGMIAYDAHSIIGAFRAWQAPRGARAYFYTLSGRRLWHATVERTGREQVKTALGTFSAIRLDGVGYRLLRNMKVDHKKPPRRFSIWISEGADRLPLKARLQTKFGEVAAQLIAYRRPDTGRADSTAATVPNRRSARGRRRSPAASTPGAGHDDADQRAGAPAEFTSGGRGALIL